MKKVVVYKSFLGSTELYAKWLAEETKSDLYRFGQIHPDMLNNYDLVCVMSGTYIGRMPLTNYLLKHWEDLSARSVIAVAVGGIPAEDLQSQLSYEMIPKEIREKIMYFKIPGRLFGTRAKVVQRGYLERIIEVMGQI